MSKNNICLIIPYFGKCPNHLSLFLKSCDLNKNFVDILFFTDLKTPAHVPENVIFHNFSLEEFNQLASKKLNITIKINWYYKLVDFKPAFGYLFSAYIEEYQYWGHGDIDLIYGNLSHFLTPLIGYYDLISVQKNYISGPFCLFRNTTYLNTLFKKSVSYPNVYTTNSLQQFDECSSLWKKLNQGISILEIDDLESMTYIVKKESLANNIVCYFETLIKEFLGNEDYIVWNNKTIKDNNGVQYMIYHYVGEKNKNSFYIPKWKNIPDKVYFDKHGAFTEKLWLKKKYKQVVCMSRYFLTFWIKKIHFTKKSIMNITRNMYYRFKPNANL